MSEKSWIRIKQRLKSATMKTSPCSFDIRIYKLNQIEGDRVNYLRMASMNGKFRDADGRVCNRLKYCIWSRRVAGEEAGTEAEKPDSSG